MQATLVRKTPGQIENVNKHKMKQTEYWTRHRVGSILPWFSPFVLYFISSFYLAYQEINTIYQYQYANT